MNGAGEAKPAAGGPDVESVRAELVRLGYLTSGVDRWFLDDVGSGRRPVRRALSGALRGALLVTLPVAVALAALLATRNPSPLGRWFDGPVLALHALVPAFAASFLLLAAAGLASTALFLRAGRTPDPALLARGIAVVLAGIGAAAAVFATADAPGGTGEAIARLVLLGILAVAVERFVEDEFLALFVALEGVAPRRARIPLLRLAAIFAVAVVLAAVAGILLRASGSANGPAPSLVVRPVPGRVVVVAVDGWDDESMQYFASRGALGELPPLVQRSAALRWDRPAASPPEVWTTLWTGVDPVRHGLASYEWVRPLGVARPLRETAPLAAWFRIVEPRFGLASLGAATATERTAAAFWEITSRAGYSTLQVGNWASGPAVPILGRTVSNRAPLRFRRGEPVEGEALPALLGSRLAALSARIPASLPDAEWLDAWTREAFLDLWGEGTEAVGVVYLPGLDLLRNPVRSTGSDRERIEFAEGLRRSYVALDAFVARLRAVPQPPAIVLVGDSGRRGDGGHGVAYVDGFGVVAGAVPARPEDLLPSLLARLGIPLSAELSGSVVGLPVPADPGRVPRYERPAPPAKADAFDAERTLRELRSLGYIR